MCLAGRSELFEKVCEPIIDRAVANLALAAFEIAKC